MESNYIFLSLLFIVAFLYSSVGHGGASAYLALMALFSFSPSIMKSSALMLNVFVSFIAFFQYYRGGFFNWKLFYPFAIASIPAAFLGAFIPLDVQLYKKILGVLILFSVLKLSGIIGKNTENTKDVNFPIALLTGACIGLFSGMIGIGGGIILSPVILLLNWGNVKQTAAVSALFILVNSIAGLIGMFSVGFNFVPDLYTWVIVAFIGGLLGAYVGVSKFTNVILTRVLAFVLLLASIKLFFV